MTNTEILTGSAALLLYIFCWVSSVNTASKKSFLSTKSYIAAMLFSPIAAIMFLFFKDGSGNKAVNPIVLVVHFIIGVSGIIMFKLSVW